MKKQAVTPASFIEAIGVRGAIAAALALAVAITLVTHRTEGDSAPTDTVGVVP